VRRKCAGCLQSLCSNSIYLRCSFASTGFPLSDGSIACPCHAYYHSKCIRAGAPFTTRSEVDAGLTFPYVSTFSRFICELCTVRSVLGRELHTIRDGVLLRLERMRLIDQAHYWSASTHKQYQNHLRHLAQFDQLHDTNILSVSPLLAPPAGPEIPLQWFQECYSLRPASVRRLEYGTVSFETVKADQDHTFKSVTPHFGSSRGGEV